MGMNWNYMTVKATLMEDMLGMASSDKNIHDTYIASLAPDAESRAEEVAALGAEEVAQKGMTVFPKAADGTPIMWDYQIRGFFKDAAGMLRRVPGSECGKWRAYLKEIDGVIFVFDRENRIILPEGMEIGNLQRPIRTKIRGVEMVALASSESVPKGSTITFTVVLMNPDLRSVIIECLRYGSWRGFGQWRNSGMGKFTFEIIDEQTLEAFSDDFKSFNEP